MSEATVQEPVVVQEPVAAVAEVAPVAVAPVVVKKPRRAKRKHTTEFKVQLIEAIKAGTKAAVLAKQYDLSMGLIYIWQGHYAKGKYAPKNPVAPQA